MSVEQVGTSKARMRESSRISTRDRVRGKIHTSEVDGASRAVREGTWSRATLGRASARGQKAPAGLKPFRAQRLEMLSSNAGARVPRAWRARRDLGRACNAVPGGTG